MMLLPLLQTGSVSLDSPAQDYTKWGVRINTSFVDKDSSSPLHTEAASGGQDGVASMLFVIAAQREMPDCPFLILDEPDTSCDIRNEKTIIDSIGRLAADEKANKQIITVTPKKVPEVPVFDDSSLYKRSTVHAFVDIS